jgi:hypothetical protein
MDMDTINDYAAIRRKPIPNIIVGTPQSIVGNDFSWEYYVGNIIAIDERVLIANNSSFSYAIDDCRFPKRLLLCLPPRVTLDRKWDLPIFEYAGPFRYFHVGEGILAKPPVRQELKLKWSINGPGKVESDLEIARLIDGHKGRFRAIKKLFDNSKLKDLLRTALVFPTHSSVEGFLAISPRFNPLNGHSAINSADPIVCTTQELIETTTVDIDTIVWAGSREYAFDFHRRMLCKRASKSPLQLFDLTDSPGGHPKLAAQIGNTLRGWAKRRCSRYRALGYHGSTDDMAEYKKVQERIARVMYQPL